MTAVDIPAAVLGLAHLAAAVVVVVVLARAGRAAATALHQPPVIGEITAGLLAGPLLAAALGDAMFDAVVPHAVLDGLHVIGQVGVVLFLVGLSHRLRSGPAVASARTTMLVAAGGVVLPVITGVLLAVWVIGRGDAALRGTAPTPAFVLMIAVAMSISAVPVMARILTSRRMMDSPAGPVTMNAAVLIDSVGWLALTGAVFLSTGGAQGIMGALAAIVLGGLLAVGLRLVLRTRYAMRMQVHRPGRSAVALGAVACAVAAAMEHLGMTAVLGAVLVGIAVPGGWDRVLAILSRIGNLLIPVFFVSVGASVFGYALSSTPLAVVLVAIVLATVGKIAGGYLGARLGDLPPRTSLQVGVLMNTRGLTELVVLQAGLSAGILTPPLVVALAVMALATTTMTGPLLSLLSRRQIIDVRRPESGLAASGVGSAG